MNSLMDWPVVIGTIYEAGLMIWLIYWASYFSSDKRCHSLFLIKKQNHLWKPKRWYAYTMFMLFLIWPIILGLHLLLKQGQKFKKAYLPIQKPA